jgi:hypothetical protein
VNACLDKQSGSPKKRGSSANDLIFIDEEKDPDFLSPPKMVKSTKMPKAQPTRQGKLNVDKSGKLVAVKPIESSSSRSSACIVEFDAGNLNSEITSYRLTLGNIDVQMAELEKEREICKKKLAKSLKKLQQLTAQHTFLVGCERRPLEVVLKQVFPNFHLSTEAGVSTIYGYGVSDSSLKIEIENVHSSKPLWELSKLAPSFDQLAAEIPSLSRSPDSLASGQPSRGATGAMSDV